MPVPLAALAAMLLLTAGCDAPRQPTTAAAPGADESQSAAAASSAARGLAYGFDVGEIKSAAAYLAEPRFAAADLARGELLSLSCQACHTLGPGERHNIGPNLHGMFGRRAGVREGFAYSEALRGTELIWTPRALEAWLVEPARFIVGNNMAFAGFRSESDRRDLIAFLLEATSRR